MTEIMKKSANYPLERDCDICVMVGNAQPRMAWYDMPLRTGRGTQWGYACPEHALSHAASGSWSMGTQINGDLPT